MTANGKRNLILGRIVRFWIFGICMLTAFVNMCGVLSFTYSLSHYTGNYIEMLYDFITHTPKSALVLMAHCGLFILGAVLAAFVNRNLDFRIQGKYGEVQLVTGVAIIAAYSVFKTDKAFIAMLCIVMGMQNGLIRSYKGMPFKTSHVTTTFTDIGLFIGDMAIGIRERLWKILFNFGLLGAYATGTIVPVYLFPHLKSNVFLVAGGAYTLMGLIYFAIRAAYGRYAVDDDR